MSEDFIITTSFRIGFIVMCFISYNIFKKVRFVKLQEDSIEVEKFKLLRHEVKGFSIVIFY